MLQYFYSCIQRYIYTLHVNQPLKSESDADLWELILWDYNQKKNQIKYLHIYRIFSNQRQLIN